MGALTSRPYSFTQRPWELYSSLANPIFENLGVFFRIDFDKGRVCRVLPTRACDLWVSDFFRFVIGNVSNDYFLRRIFSRGDRFSSSLTYFLNIFPSFLYRTGFIGNRLLLTFRNFNYSSFFDFNINKCLLISKLWPCFEVLKKNYLFNYLVFNPFKNLLKFLIKIFCRLNRRIFF